MKSILNQEELDSNNVVENQKIIDLICPICLNLIKKPISCSSNIICHSFCKNE